MSRLPLGILTLIAVFLGWVAQARSDDDVHWKAGKYSIDLVRVDEFAERLSISANGEAVFQIDGQRVLTDWKDFMNSDVPGSIKPPEAGFSGPQDPLHLGTPTFIAVDWSGGAHCCFTLHIVMLGDHLQALPAIKLFDAEQIGFVKLASRPQTVLLIPDFTFAYWHASFADSSAVDLPYSFNPVKKEYLPDAELMRQPAPSDAVLAIWRDEARTAQVDGVASADGVDVPRAITERVLELIYSGNLGPARSFLASVWPYSKEQQTRYWDNLITCQIRFSPAWPAIAKLNRLSPDKAASGCRKHM